MHYRSIYVKLEKTQENADGQEVAAEKWKLREGRVWLA